MKLDGDGLLWAMDTLVNAGHPDPEGLIAKVESSQSNNITGISEDEAKAVGVANVEEPVMSMYAASLYDARKGRRYRVADSTRGAIGSRVTDAVYNGAVPKNPFLDEEGYLVLSHEPPKSTVPSDKKLLDEIYKLMDTVL